MDDKFNEQKDILIAIKKEISLLHQQVDFLIRNEKSLELLDLDVMMNRTHKIYDMMCGVDIGSEAIAVDEGEEELPVGLDTIREMFGIEEKTEEKLEEELPEEEDELLEEEKEEEGGDEKEEAIEENDDAYFIEEVDDVSEEMSSEGREFENPTPTEHDVEPQPTAFPVENEESSASERLDLDKDRGFILNFEPVEEPAKEENGSTYTTGDEIEMSVPLIDTQEEEAVEETSEEEIAYEPVVIGDMEEKEDGGFEFESPETLGDRFQQEQDPTLADKLQHSTLNSLQSAIGINDKFLFVNELFNGSMEKYNRSIANLDDLKTLNGALIYLNELRIELQWNSSNEAYKKLLELVHCKFGA